MKVPSEMQLLKPSKIKGKLPKIDIKTLLFSTKTNKNDISVNKICKYFMQ